MVCFGMDSDVGSSLEEQEKNRGSGIIVNAGRKETGFLVLAYLYLRLLDVSPEADTKIRTQRIHGVGERGQKRRLGSKGSGSVGFSFFF